MPDKNLPEAQVALISVGLAPEDLLEWLAVQVPAVTGIWAAVCENVPLPTGGYDSHRGQYRGESVLAVLHNLAPVRAGQVVGLIDADCYTPGLNYIFGQAASGGREAFVALPRLRESFYGRSGNPTLFYQRVLKEVVHELGHSLGLPHCLDPHCVMHFSNSLQDTDLKSASFCAQCKSRLANCR